jgi:hypothetical protein
MKFYSMSEGGRVRSTEDSGSSMQSRSKPGASTVPSAVPHHRGGESEWFTRNTWMQRDICAREPSPFRDRSFDFVICSHTLEDVRDPLGVCSELVRVGKAGHIEVPSRADESTWGVERPHQAGLAHHRWLIDIRENEVVFLPEYAMIYRDWGFALSPRHWRKLFTDSSVQWLWWKGSFGFREITIHGVENVEAELERFVKRTHSHARWRVGLDRLHKELRRLGRQARSIAGRVRDPIKA